MQLDNGVLSFVAQEEVAGTLAVHKSVFRQCCSARSVAKEVEGSFLIRIPVRIVEAHPMTGQVLQSGLAKIIRKSISGGLSSGGVAAPAIGIVPFVATAGGVHVNGDQSNVARSQLRAKEVGPAAALGERYIFVFRNQEFGVETEGGEGGHNPAGNFPVVRPFEEAAVRRALSCSFPAVSVVN